MSDASEKFGQLLEDLHVEGVQHLMRENARLAARVLALEEALKHIEAIATLEGKYGTRKILRTAREMVGNPEALAAKEQA